MSDRIFVISYTVAKTINPPAMSAYHRASIAFEISSKNPAIQPAKMPAAKVNLAVWS